MFSASCFEYTGVAEKIVAGGIPVPGNTACVIRRVAGSYVSVCRSGGVSPLPRSA